MPNSEKRTQLFPAWSAVGFPYRCLDSEVLSISFYLAIEIPFYSLSDLLANAQDPSPSPCQR
jgi:hypothetical protein